MKQYDAIIIGAGPVGLYLASLLKQFRVVVLEEHSRLGGKACSGVVSANMDRFISAKKEFVEHKIKCIEIKSGRSSMKIEKEKFLAYVINREKIEMEILEKLGKDRVLFQRRAERIEIKRDRVVVKTKKGDCSAKLLIGCDGANSVVAKAINQRPKEIILGLTAVVSKPDYSGFAEVFVDKKIVSDGFLWKIPRGRTTEYGMLGKNVKFEILENFFRIKDYEKNAALIPMGPPVKTYSGRVLLVGDAAGQIKPWTGGGIIYGMAAAAAAAEVVKKAIENNDFSEEFLKNYEIKWRNILGKNIGYGLFLRNVFKKMNNFEIRVAIRIAKMLRKNVSKKDYDFPF